jgi:hypothetical protein
VASSYLQYRPVALCLTRVSCLSSLPHDPVASYVLGHFNQVQWLLAHKIKYQTLICTFSLCMIIFATVILLNRPLSLRQNRRMEPLPLYTEVEKSRELRHLSKALCRRARRRQYQSRVLRDKNAQLLRVTTQCVHCQIRLRMTLYGTPPYWLFKNHALSP